MAATGAANAAAGLADRLSVLTFNMQHKDRPRHMSLMADQLRADLEEVPDFILFQEVLFGRSDQEEPNTAAVLAEELGYHWKGTKRTSDREGVAIASRYPFAFYDSRNLKSQTSRFFLGFRRVSVMGEFLVPNLGRVRVVNVHLTNWAFEHRVRSNQLKETLKWIAQRERQVHADVTILGGDFNIEPDWDELDLIADRKLTGGITFENYNSDDPTRGGAGRPTKRVDYVFIATPQHDFRFLGEQRLWLEGIPTKAGGSSRIWLSDHVPVLHEFAIAGPSTTNVALSARAVRIADDLN